MSLNKFQIIGNVGNPPELRRMPNGNPVANYSVAVAGGYFDKNEQWVETTDWFPITVYDRQAENDAKHLVKGSMIFVEGQIRPWKSEKDGEKKYGFNFIATNVQYLRKPLSQDDDYASAHGEFANDYKANAENTPRTVTKKTK